ncbi:chalcone synthase, putative [Heliomicrobium modesticaldum Ice1]|uniref:Chalcone synthase, putative n=1 Tax=Heliobacterium modesticaldum (strain ATCC 51547 / Ice1) TaxID=498761 RepID=B0TF40_HELMI|nr:3-oxoacyl-[acyl-carrier-protein] synthase III C-terminal domain-containing protein [Heliomicrobium modesticaldum]ABZ83023.1 chalcone synthase, putative [Heliomicrobium modesticaldum Ice1]
MPRIVSIASAVPDHVFYQEDICHAVQQMFSASFRDLERLLPIFQNAQIDKRHFCVPMDWFQQNHSFAEKNSLYIENAVDLGVRAVTQCLNNAGLAPEDVDCFLFVSSTGIATPTIDVRIANKLAMKPSLRRLPLWGLGCAGGCAGVARAAELAIARPGRPVLLLTLELCGLTFLWGDRSKGNLIATSLFGDGAAAAVIVEDGQTAASDGASPSPALSPQIIASQTTCWPDTLDIMGWDVQDEGLKVIFSRDIPAFVLRHIPPAVDAFLREQGLERSAIDRLIAHPGGAKVISAYEECLGLSSEQTRLSRQVLREYGNMSSATILFVLERAMEERSAENCGGDSCGNHGGGGICRGEYALMTALGPGFCSELALLRW